MKPRLILLTAVLVFVASLGVGLFPGRVSADGSPPSSFKYTGNDWSGITTQTSDGSQSYHKTSGSTTGYYNGGGAVGYDGCVAVIQTDDQTYSGDKNAQWWASCDDGVHDKTSITIAGGTDSSIGAVNTDQRQVFDYELCPALKGIDMDLFNKECNIDYAKQSDQDRAVNAICTQYATQLKAQCDDYNNKTYNPANAPGNDEDSCEASGGGFNLNWILCSAYQGIQAVVNWMFTNIITPLLVSTPICLPGNSSCDPTIYQIWSHFRIYGDIFLVITLLVIVFGESIGGGLIEAYTAKKILPRLLAAAILLNLSIYIMAFAIDMTNIIGGGLGQLLTGPLNGNGLFTIKPGNITAGAIFGTVLGTGLLAGAFAINVTGIALLLLGLAITGAIAILGVFFTLIIRQAIIIGLVLVSPIAFALWCLPNTEKWFKRWWDTFFQMLLVYPMIVVLFAVADVMSYLTSHNGNGGSYVNNIVAFMLLLIPLYLVPFTLRSSNRLMGAIQGAASNVGRQINAVSGRRALSASGQEFGKTFAKRRAGEARFKNAPAGSIREKLNTGIARAANIESFGKAGLRPRNMRGSLDAAVGRNKNTARRKLAEESDAFQTFAGNDDMLEASMLMFDQGEGAARHRLAAGNVTGRAQDTAIAQIRTAQRQMGSQNLALTAAVANAGTGTGYAGKDDNDNAIGQGQMYDSIIRASGGDMAVAGSAYAEARGGAEKARRNDLLESFGSAMEHMDAINSSTTVPQRLQQIQRANREGVLIAREVQGDGGILGARGQAVQRFGEVIQQGQQDALQAVVATRDGADAVVHEYDGATERMHDVTVTPEEAERRWIQQMASDSTLLDSAGGAAPEVKRMLADTAHNGQLPITELPENLRTILIGTNRDGAPRTNPDGTPITTMSMNEAYERLENVEAFRQMKKVYRNQIEAGLGGGGDTGGGDTT